MAPTKTRRSPDTPTRRKRRGAFFTPWDIADFLGAWAVGANPGARVLDPTSGEGVFLLAAARHLHQLDAPVDRDLADQLFGVDVHRASLDATAKLLEEEGARATLRHGDFFAHPSPAQLGAKLPWMDAVIGNPPFVRYQEHRGHKRDRSAAAALAEGVRLSGLASSWAALLVHACAFLKPEGRVAMVLPAELLTVGYAEPIRRWLMERFGVVHLVLFEQLQFADAEEQVVLLVARGSGGCEALSLIQVRDAEELASSHLFDSEAVAVTQPEDKWTNLMLPRRRRAEYRRVVGGAFRALGDYGRPELGTVTGANRYFTLNEQTRADYGIARSHLKRVIPAGARAIPGSRFTNDHWRELKRAGQRVWLLCPSTRSPRAGLAAYIAQGESDKVDAGYKCSIRDPWWRPPAVPAPDLLFTYMSHITPRLVANETDATFLNSLHGLTLAEGTPDFVRDALPLLALNSLTMLGAELNGRSYGGGILKMEPSEAAQLPVPDVATLEAAWEAIEPERNRLDALLREGRWSEVVDEVDRAVLVGAVGLSADAVAATRADAAKFRRRRLKRES